MNNMIFCMVKLLKKNKKKTPFLYESPVSVFKVKVHIITSIITQSDVR